MTKIKIPIRDIRRSILTIIEDHLSDLLLGADLSNEAKMFIVNGIFSHIVNTTERSGVSREMLESMYIALSNVGPVSYYEVCTLTNNITKDRKYRECRKEMLLLLKDIFPQGIPEIHTVEVNSSATSATFYFSKGVI